MKRNRLKKDRDRETGKVNGFSTNHIERQIPPEAHTSMYVWHKVEERVRKKIESLYLTTCRDCGEEFPFTCAIWESNKCLEIRYQTCPKCGGTCRADCELNDYDYKLLKKIESSKIKGWYPENKFYYPDGMPFKEKQQYDSVDELFTKRNLQALAWLMDAIEEEPSKGLRDFLKIGFSSVSHLCSRLLAEGRPGYRPFSGVGWNQQSYWYTPRYMESNVWDKFESAIKGHQGLLKAKVESNKKFKDIKIGSSFEQVISGNADVFIYNGSCIDLMKKMPVSAVDYIFTDPPYDASIQYGELSYMWVSWLKMNGDYLKDVLANEIIRNERQHKDFNVYHSLLSSSFQGMFKVLKPKHYLTLTFHNPTFKIRNSTIRAGVFTGFEFQKIHHQELARPSAKSLLQPFGSAQGDFYLRFYKQRMKSAVIHPKEIDELRFEKIVVDTTIALLAERAEPTPYTIIINYIDPVLAKQGYFSSLDTGLDINAVLKNHLDKEFVLLPTKIGGAEGKLWWFKDTAIVPRLHEIPLTERVEQT
ncbi:MAG: hypothetical protein HY753_04325, partial [Nitrospirae bacterium]|nr:hypothetical protein [Nitrospirota bacterium]